MSWYYADAGKQVGPISKADLDGLFYTGAITRETLVWTEGMAGWQSYGEAGAPGDQSPVRALAPVEVCSECGQAFPAEDVIRYGNSAVCAECKPVFLQKLREGAAVPAGLVYGGFWIRAAALLIDTMILWVVNFVLAILLLTLAGSPGEDDPQMILQIAIFMMQVLAGMVYEVWFLGGFGATPGKMACRLKVVTAEGERISYLLAFGRYLAKILSGLLLGIGYLLAAFDEEKRTLHDRICHTRVVKIQ
jgi:uncharacterized RDD family membrane protein YckC